MIEKLNEGIFRLCIPFEGIYTTVFFLTDGSDLIVVDAGTTRSDALAYVIPAIKSFSITPRLLLCTHLHDDHCGGIETVVEQFPKIIVGLYDPEKEYPCLKTIHLLDGDLLLERYKVFNLKGHSKDCLAVYDVKTGILISGDCLQQRGIARWGTAVEDYDSYVTTLERVATLNPREIIASHDYVPCGYRAKETDTAEMLSECKKAIDDVISFAEANPDLLPNEAAKCFNEMNSTLPTVPYTTFEHILGG